jgi:hypothetical protein
MPTFDAQRSRDDPRTHGPIRDAGAVDLAGGGDNAWLFGGLVIARY